MLRRGVSLSLALTFLMTGTVSVLANAGIPIPATDKQAEPVSSLPPSFYVVAGSFAGKGESPTAATAAGSSGDGVAAGNAGETERNVPAPVSPVSQLQLQPEPGAVALTWRESGDRSAAGFRVYWRQSGAPALKGPLAVSAGEQHARVEGLVNGKSYELQVAAIDDTGRESPRVAGNVVLPTGVSIARISVAAAGVEKPARAAETPPEVDMSADGRYVAFTSSAALAAGAEGDALKVYVYDRIRETTVWVSRPLAGAAARDSVHPRISGDGRYVVFQSADRITPGDDNGVDDVFLYDRDSAKSMRISADPLTGHGSSAASLAPEISADGRWVYFTSWAKDLVSGDTNDSIDIYAYDRVQRTLSLNVAADGGAFGGSWSPSVSRDGSVLAFVATAARAKEAGDGTGMDSPDLYVTDRRKGTTERITVDAPDISGVAVSGNGAYVAFASGGRNYVYDKATGTLSEMMYTLVNGTLLEPNPATWRWNADGSILAFSGTGNGSGGTYVYDLQRGKAEEVSRSYLNRGGGEADSLVAMSDDGRMIAFGSRRDDLVAGDGNGSADVFVRDMRPDLPPSGCGAGGSSGACAGSGSPLAAGSGTAGGGAASAAVAGAAAAASIASAQRWSRSYVDWLAYDRRLTGFAGARFMEPDHGLTRAELVQLLVPLLRGRSGWNGHMQGTAFRDVTPVDSFYGDVQEAAANGLVEGDGNGLFRPHDIVTREEMLTVVSRGWLLGGPAAAASGGIDAFRDAPELSAWAKPAFAGAVALGVIEGYDDGTLRPQATVTLEQAAAVGWRADRLAGGSAWRAPPMCAMAPAACAVAMYSR